MKSIRIKIGEKGHKQMPYSEVCMHMQVAGKPMGFELLPGAWGASVQLYRDDGLPFSAPILTGEAGLYEDANGYYYYPSESA